MTNCNSIQQNPTTKYIIGLQPQTTTQIFTSTPGNQSTCVYRQVSLQNHNNTPNWHKIQKTKGPHPQIIQSRDWSLRLKISLWPRLQYRETSKVLLGKQRTRIHCQTCHNPQATCSTTYLGLLWGQSQHRFKVGSRHLSLYRHAQRTPTNLLAINTRISRLRLRFLMGPHPQNTAQKIFYLKVRPSDTPTSLYMPTKPKHTN